MMLIGFGGIAMAMRRRGQGMALAQVAEPTSSDNWGGSGGDPGPPFFTP